MIKLRFKSLQIVLTYRTDGRVNVHVQQELSINSVSIGACKHIAIKYPIGFLQSNGNLLTFRLVSKSKFSLASECKNIELHPVVLKSYQIGVDSSNAFILKSVVKYVK